MQQGGMKSLVSVFRPGPEGFEILRVKGAAGAIPLHLHASWCLIAVESGERHLSSAGCSVVVRPGGAVAVPAGLAHACSSPGCGCDFLAVSIPADMLPAWMRDFKGTRIFRLASDGFFTERLATVMETRDVQEASALPELLSRAVSDLDPVAAGARNAPEPGEAIVEKARLILDNPETSGLGLPEISRRAGASPFHLSRQFRRVTGLPPGEYRTLAQLRQARALLVRGAALADAAAASGFHDQSHLTLRFKKYMGITPGQFARACR